MRITVNGTPHQVDFRHGWDGFYAYAGPKGTTCYLDASPDPNGFVHGTGRVVCHPKDTFRKAEGRKRSLARALKARGYSKAWRTVFWAAYFKQAKQ